MRLLYLAAAWVAGLLLGSMVSGAPLWALGCASVALAAGAFLLAKVGRPAAPALLLALLALGMLRAGAHDDSSLYAPPEGGEWVEVEGTIASHPENRGAGARFRFHAENIDRGQGWEPLGQTVLVNARPATELVEAREAAYFRYGDRLTLRGRIERPPIFDAFDYRDYLARQGIHLTMVYPRLSLEGEGGGNPVMARLYSLRSTLSRAVDEALPEPQAALGQSLLLGERSGLPADLRDAFRNTGTSHLLAISGLHVGVVFALSAGVAAHLLGRRRHFYLLAPLLAVWGYALLSGLSPSVTRAALMASVFLVATAVGRERNALPALALAAALMAGLNPSVLGQVSFQLSFAAVAGIALMSPPLIEWMQERLGLAEGSGGLGRALLRGTVATLAVSIAATVATLPLVAFNFQQVSPLGIPATILALPALPAVLSLTGLAAAGSLIHPSVGEVAGWAAWLSISYLKSVVELFARAPGSLITLPPLSGALMWVYYGALATAVVTPHYWRRFFRAKGAGAAASVRRGLGDARAWMAVPAAALTVFAVVAWFQALPAQDGRLHVVFLDVGQGDSVFIVTPQGRRILVDGGADPTRAVEALNAHLPFWDRDLDVVVATHPDEDHLSGLIGVVNRHTVSTVVEGVGDDSALYLQWQEALSDRGLEPVAVHRGYEIDTGGVVDIDVLNPTGEADLRSIRDTNDNSVVLRVSYGAVSFLLTGDIGARVEGRLVDDGVVARSTVLKASHHGSKYSTTPEFIAAVGPAAAVVQAGAENRYGHPHGEVLALLDEAVGEENVYITAEDGSVEFITDGVALWVKLHR